MSQRGRIEGHLVAQQQRKGRLGAVGQEGGGVPGLDPQGVDRRVASVGPIVSIEEGGEARERTCGWRRLLER